MVSFGPRQPSVPRYTRQFQTLGPLAGLGGEQRKSLGEVGAAGGVVPALFEGIGRLGQSLVEGENKKLADQVMREADAEGLAEGERAALEGRLVELKEADTLRGQAFNASLQKAYFARKDIQVTEMAATIAREHAFDPEGFDERFDSMAAAHLETTPAEWRPAFKQQIDHYKAKFAIQIGNNVFAKEMEAANADLLTAGDTYADRAAAAYRTGDEAEAKLNALKFREALSGRTDLSEQQKASALIAFKDMAASQTVMGVFDRTLTTEGIEKAGRFVEAFKADGDLDGAEGGEAVINPDAREKIAAAMESRLTHALQANRAEAAAVRTMVDDHIASIQSTGQGVPGLGNRVDLYFQPDEAAEFHRRERVAVRYHEAVQTIRFADPAGMAEQLERWRPKPGSATFAEDERLFDGLQRGAQKILAQRADDPAGYTMQSPQVSQAFEAAKTASPSAALTGMPSEMADSQPSPAFQRALAYRIRMQEEMGVAPSATRVLSAGETDGLIASFNSATDKAAQMANMQATYGALFPRVVAEMADKGLDSRYQVLASTVGNPALSRTMAQVLQAGSKELRDGLDRGVATDVARDVNSALAPFLRTVALGDFTGGRTKAINDISSSVEDLAIHYYRQSGDASQAVQRATDEVINNRYIVGDTWYAPRAIDGVAVSQNKIEATMEARQTRARLREFAPEPLGSLNDVPKDVRREAIISTALESGYWVTNEAGSGVFLMVPLNGGALPLLDRNGNRYEIDFMEATQSSIPSRLRADDPFLPPDLRAAARERRR